MLIDWTPEGGPFGNAGGLDYVSIDVKIKIAEDFGATVLIGRLPDDLNEKQQEMTAPERDRHHRTYEIITISHDGLTVSGDYKNGYCRGYRSSYWLDRITPETVVFDLRTVPDDRIVAFAVRGPMVDVSLPPGKVYTMPIPEHMRGVADAYLAPYGGLDNVLGT